MIRIKLAGGLGNQMFQYAAARSLAKKRNTKVVLDLSWFSLDLGPETTSRQYELDSFVLSSAVSLASGVGLIHKLQLKSGLIESYKEKHFEYDPGYIGLGSRTDVTGYFQSEKYFVHIREDILSDFSWAKPATRKNKKLLDTIDADENSVSIHVRRGDYVSNESAAEFHGLRGVDYYQAAVKIIEKSVKTPNYYVFSDEPDWCKENLKFKHNTTYIDWNTDGAEDMRLMKSCRHNVLANSSFSWWGAWLNTNEDKIVVAPKQWFNDPSINTNDVVPESWQRV